MQLVAVDNKQLNIRLDRDDMRKLHDYAEKCEITPAALAGFFMRAAIRAADRQGYLRVPLEFDIKDPVALPRPIRHQFNEPEQKTNYKTQK